MKAQSIQSLMAMQPPGTDATVLMVSGDRFTGTLDSRLTALSDTVTITSGNATWRLSVEHIIGVSPATTEPAIITEPAE